MPTIKRTLTVPYSATQMFELVNRIEDYPHFVPWCKSAEILTRTPDEIRARLDFSRGGLHKSFTTQNRLQSGKMIEVRLVEGPFHNLEGFWMFEDTPDGSTVTLDMSFEFSNKLTSMMFGPLFTTVTNLLVDVFCQRATQVYGK